MLIRIFEDTINNEYYIDDNDFKVYRKCKNGTYNNIKWFKMKYGYSVYLYRYDSIENRNHKRYVYVHSIIGKYILNLKRKYIITYNDKNIYNLSKDNIGFRYLKDICHTWKPYIMDNNLYVSNKGDVYNEYGKYLLTYSISSTNYVSYCINSRLIKRSNLVWEHFGNKPFKEGYVVDHIDNNPSNDNINNLQLITIRENIIKDIKKKSSLPVGVHKDGNRYRAYIGYMFDDVYYENAYLGSFNNPSDASSCYQKALSLIEQGINPIKSGDNKNIKYKFSTDKWYYYVPSEKGGDKYIGDFDTYDKALSSYNSHDDMFQKLSNETDEEKIIRKGYFSFKFNGITYTINKRKYGDIEFINAFKYYNKCKENSSIQEFVNNILLIREKIKNEHDRVCNELKEEKTKNKKANSIKSEKREILGNIKYEDGLSKEVLDKKLDYIKEMKLIEFMNKPNYVQNSYNDCYTLKIPYKDGKYYYLHSFKNKELVDEIDSIMTEYKHSDNFIELFNQFKINKLPSYIEKDSIYRQEIESANKNKLGYSYLPNKDLYRVRKRLNKKLYMLGHYKDERCCKYILDECNNAIKLGIFDTWYRDIEKHKLRVRNMFNDLTLYRSRNVASLNRQYLEENS